jgi:transposase InsO family protein
MKEDVIMKAATRYEVLLKANQGLISSREASCLMDLSYRHTLRLREKAKKEGLKGLFYKRTHTHPQKVDTITRQKILKLRQTYPDYNLSHFRDTLNEEHRLSYSLEFYRRLLLSEGLHQPRKVRRKKAVHRKRFEAAQAGLLIQRDTSIHFWAPESEKPWKLILDLDDHSRMITGALFSLHDDVLSNLAVTHQTLSTYGLPTAYYTDNNPIFNPLRRLPKTYQYFRYRQGAEDETLPQFKRALSEFGIQMIQATPYQPQGKGKVERIFRFLQDRLLKEMAQKKITTVKEANGELKRFVRWYNTRWVHGTTGEIPETRLKKNIAFRPLPKGKDLAQILCLKFARVVKSDNTVQLAGQTYQIPPNAYRIGYAKAPVEVRVYLNRELGIFYKNEIIAYGKKLKSDPNDQGLGDILSLQTL